VIRQIPDVRTRANAEKFSYAAPGRAKKPFKLKTMKPSPRTVGWEILFILSALGLVAATDALAARRYSGVKYPNSPAEGAKAIHDEAWGPDEFEALRGHASMLPYVQPSPDQEDAGTCLYMSLTGVAEWWMNRLHPLASGVVPDGENDLSERHLIHLPKNANVVKNWKTDTLLATNAKHRLLRNRSYRFAKGWTKNGRLAQPNAQGAQYGTMVNWISQSPADASDVVILPTFSRRILAADPSGSQWGVGAMPGDIVERVKRLLDEDSAPVQVIYNHYGYWHSVFIVGYDDDRSTEGCGMVSGFIEEGLTGATKVKKLYDADGGCAPTGVFYVRDSIYSDTSEPTYVYDPANPQSNAPYSKRLIYREYQWLKYLSNHAIEWKAAARAP